MAPKDEKDGSERPDERINANADATPADIERAKDKWHTDGGSSFRALLDAEPTDEVVPPPAAPPSKPSAAPDGGR